MKLKELTLFDEDRWRLGSNLNEQEESIDELFTLIEEKMTDSSVLSLPWATVTEIAVEQLDFDYGDGVEVVCQVRATFSHIDSLCRACLNCDDEEFVATNSKLIEMSGQVRGLIESIRNCG